MIFPAAQMDIQNTLNSHHVFILDESEQDFPERAKAILAINREHRQTFGLLCSCLKSGLKAQLCYLDDIELIAQHSGSQSSDQPIISIRPMAIFERSVFPNKQDLINEVLRQSKPKVRLAQPRVVVSPKIQKQPVEVKQQSNITIKPLPKIRDEMPKKEMRQFQIGIPVKKPQMKVEQEQRKKVTPQHIQKIKMQIEDRPKNDSESDEDHYQPKNCIRRKLWDGEQEQVIKLEEKVQQPKVQVKVQSKVMEQESEDEDLLIMLKNSKNITKQEPKIEVQMSTQVKQEVKQEPHHQILQPIKKVLNTSPKHPQKTKQSTLFGFLPKKVQS